MQEYTFHPVREDFRKREVNTQMANVFHRCLMFVVSYSIRVHWGKSHSKSASQKEYLVFPCNQNCSWMNCSCSVSLPASHHSQCLLWHLLLSGVFILAHGSHFVCNLKVSVSSSQCALSLFPFLSHSFLLFSPYFSLSPPLQPLPIFLSLKHYFPSVYYEPETLSTVCQKCCGYIAPPSRSSQSEAGCCGSHL